MFTGIIQEMGTAEKTGKTLKVRAGGVLKDKKTGDSIAVDGVCLTITKLSKNSFWADVIAETAKLTTLGKLKPGQKVNLEPAMKCGGILNGHFVTGHIDTTGKILKNKNGTVDIGFHKKFKKYIAKKGSITINGVSLTVADLDGSIFTVKLIPHTIKNTNLGNLKKNDKVNIEVDILARYLEQLLNEAKKQPKTRREKT